MVLKLINASPCLGIACFVLQGDIVLLSQTGNAVLKKTSSGRQAVRGAKNVVSPINMDNAYEV